MLVVKLIGGLGNQMFQYAYAKALEKRDYEVKLDISAFDTYKLHGGYQLNKYNIDIMHSTSNENNKYYNKTFLFKILRHFGLCSSSIIKENGLLFDGKLLKVDDNKYIEGYFQTEKYFSNIRQELLQEFTLVHALKAKEREISEKIKSGNSISIHVRRGDYVSNQNANDTHGVCDSSYFKKSLLHLKVEGKMPEKSIIYVFSDDISWCRENLDFECNTTFVDGCSDRPEVDMILMSQCSHQIISNSTFSWWGAWLNQNKDKCVIAPEQWFKNDEFDSSDIIPDSWIQL